MAPSIQLLLSLLGAGIGLGTVDTNAGSTPTPGSLGLGAGIWWVVSSCMALIAGGYVAAWLAGIELRFDGMLHGLVTWSIATLLTFWLLTSAIGGIIGGGFSALSSVASAAGRMRHVAPAASTKEVHIRLSAVCGLKEGASGSTSRSAATSKPSLIAEDGGLNSS